MLDVSDLFAISEDLPLGSEFPSLRLIGQENDGILIYTWDAPKQADRNAAEVSHIGIYDSATKTSKVVLVHDKKVLISSCSIDQSHTFIGFVTVEPTNVTGTHGKRDKQDIYKAYLAEIKPQNRTFYLNLERDAYMKLQFIYGSSKSKAMSARESHMIVFLHKESIGLYHLPVSRNGNIIGVLSGEPRKEQVIHKKFIWSQWDAQRQTLYVVYFRKHGKDSQGSTTFYPLLVGYQLSLSASAEPTFDFVLSLPLDSYRTKNKHQYFDDGPLDTIADKSLTLRVLTILGGGMVVCYQARTSETKQVEDTNSTYINYSVLILHHGKTLTCRCSHLPYSVAKNGRLHFSMLGDYLLVYLPGYFTQLLNLGIEFEPSHHISWRDPNWSLKSPEKCASHNDNNLVPGLLLPFMDKTTKDSYSTCVYEPSTGAVYRLSISHKAICDIFKSSSDLTTRAALLHYTLLHAKDMVLTQRLFRVLCEDTFGPDLPTLMVEFLIGSSFGKMRTKVDVRTLQCFPFTSLPTLRGQSFNGGSLGTRLLNISYSNLNISQFGDRRSSGVQHNGYWEFLALNIKAIGKSSRFSCQGVKQLIDQEALYKYQAIDKQNSSLLRRLEAAAKSAFSGHMSVISGAADGTALPSRDPISSLSNLRSEVRGPSRTDQILGTSPPFLARSGAESQICEQQAKVLQKTVEVVTGHLINNIRKESRNKLRAVAEEYTRIQMYMSRLLCHLIWSILGSDDAEFIPLNIAANSTEKTLFRILERFHISTELLAYPRPPGLKFYFTALAFRNLRLRDFLQYVDRGVLHLSIEIVTQVLEDLDDSSENTEAKLQTISRLSKDDALECLQNWDSPISKKFLSSKYTTTCITDDGPVGWEIFPTPPNLLTGETRSIGGSHRSLSGNLFAPAKTLIRLLENKDPGLPIGECLANFHVDSRYLEEAALLYTNAESDCCTLQRD